MTDFAPLVEEGLRHHGAGRMIEAAQCYQRAYAEDPGEAEALLLLGIIARQSKQYELSVQLTELAVRSKPQKAHYHFNLALAHQATANFDGAERSFRKALELDRSHGLTWCCLGELEVARGRHEEARHAWEVATGLLASARAEIALGDLLCSMERWEEAVTVYLAGAAKDSKNPAAYYGLASALAALGRNQEAKASYGKAIHLRPDRPEVLLNLGNLHYAEGEYSAAGSCYRRALGLRPTYQNAWINLGNTLRVLGRKEAAIECYDRVLKSTPDNAAAQHNKGNTLLDLKRPDEAEVCLRKSLGLDSSRAEHYNGLGNALFQQHRNDEAAECYDKALAMRPDYSAAHTNLANVLTRQGQRAKALHHFERAVSIDPKSPGGHYNLALAYLSEGRYSEGWREHEWRWEFRELNLRRREFAQPLWTGEPLKEGPLLLHAEQGLGDTLQFVRYALLASGRVDRVILEVQAPLKRLLGDLPGISSIIAYGEPIPAFSHHCPLMSLPFAFRTSFDNIPAPVPYVDLAAAQIEAAWQQWPGNGFRVGLAWAGNPLHRNDHARSIPLRALLPLASMRGVQWFSLQTGTAANQIQLASDLRLTNNAPLLRDFADTAALVATLDLVISVDTAVAHLAGAMGKQAFVILPHQADWRWMQNGDETHWYPTVRLFRQSAPGEWKGVVEHLGKELLKRATSSVNGLRDAATASQSDSLDARRRSF